MKRRKNSARVAAAILAACMIIGDAAPALAAEQAAVTVAAKPGQVANLRFETKTEGILENSVLSWDAVQGAEYYEIRITDAQGRVYPDWADADWSEQLQQDVYEVGYASTDELEYDLNGLYSKDTYAYQLNADNKTYARTQNKMLPGTAYKVSVRAVNSYVNDLIADEVAYGDWSVGIDFTTPAVTSPEKLANVKLYTPEAQDAYISFTKGKEDDSVQAEIKDSLGREYFADYFYAENGVLQPEYLGVWGGSFYLSENVSAYVWEQKDVDGDGQLEYVRKQENEKYITPFQNGITYMIRLRAVNTSGEKEAYSDWSDVITYTVTENAAPEATGNVKYVARDVNRISWNEAKNAKGYEVELTDGTVSYNEVSSEWDEVAQTYKNVLQNIRTSSNSLSTMQDYYSYELKGDGTTNTRKDAAGKEYRAFVPGASYTVKVRSYNDKKDGTKQYSDWTVAYTFTVPTIGKVKGVAVTGNGIRWDEELSAAEVSTKYQIEIKDAEGRVYGEDPDKNKRADGTWDWEEQYYAVNGTSSCDLPKRLNTYVEDKDAKGTTVCYIPLLHTASGEPVEAFEPGKTYSVRVRASRTYDGQIQYGAWSDAVSYTVDSAYVSGVQAKPAKVTGLVLKTDGEDGESLNAPVFNWNEIENVEKYEIEIKDADGNVYSHEPYYINKQFVTDYLSAYDNSASLSNLAGYNSYVKKAGMALERVQNAAGEDAKTFEAGKRYTIRVRAVNAYKVWNKDKADWDAKDYYYGEWSSAVTYTPAKASALTGLKYVRSDEWKYYFTYKATVENSRVWYQIATDANFNSASMVMDWTSVSSSEDLLSILKSDLEEGKTYYIRAVNYPSAGVKAFAALTGSEIAALKPAVTSFKTTALTAPKAIKGFKLYKESSDAFTFRFNAVLKWEDGDYYELQTTQNRNSANWSKAADNSLVIEKDDLNKGTTYVRAVAYVYRENELTGNNEKVYGTPSNIVSVTKNDATSKISKLKLAEKTDNGLRSAYTFAFSGKVDKSQEVEYQFSDSKKFYTNGEYDTQEGYAADTVNNRFSISYTDLTPGKKYYVRARVYNPNANSDAAKYSAYTNVVTVSTVIPEVSAYVYAVTDKSITLTAEAGNNDAYLTGYQIQRKLGKQWVDVAKTSDSTYTEKKLKANTTYSYRVRAYYFDTETKKNTNGVWVYTEGTTWGAALKLTAKAASKTSVALSWKKVSGAQGYEVYRCLGLSHTTQISDGKLDVFEKYKLVKTLDAKKTSYTDKGLTSGMDYTYKVVAYKMMDNKKVTIEEVGNSVSLAWKLNEISVVRKSNGKVVWTWNPVYSAKGYLVEKKDSVTGKWSTYKKIKKAKTNSITLPKTKDQKGVEYRMRAYTGTKYTNALTCKVEPVLVAPTSVKAKASAKNGAVTISWKKVSGADYYKVFRTTDSRSYYNADTKSYVASATEIPSYVADKSKVSGYRKLEDDELTATKLVDRPITYARNGVVNTVYEGPKKGVTYYYYVVAYKKAAAFAYTDDYGYDDYYDYRDGTTTISGKSKAASVTVKATAPKKTTLKSAKAAKGKVTLKYKKVTGADGYDIYRSASKTKGYEAVGAASGETKVSYVDKNSKNNKIKKGKTYYYKVRAFVYDDVGNKVYGSYSVVKQVKAK